MGFESGAPPFSISCFTEHPMEARDHLSPGNTLTKWHHMSRNVTHEIVISHKGIWDTDQKQIKSCHKSRYGPSAKKESWLVGPQRKDCTLQGVKWVMIPTEIALFRSMTLLPFESLGLMELMNALPLSLWSVHPWSEVHCPPVDLKHHQLWACWLRQVVLCWGAGDPLPLFPRCCQSQWQRWH